VSAITKLIDDLDAKAAKATPGPWTHDQRIGYDGIVQGEPANCGCDKPYVAKCANDRRGADGWIYNPQDEANAKHIVAAVNAAPILSRIVRAAVEYRAACKTASSVTKRIATKRLFAALDDAEAEAAR
jgi:hypothetical protein